MQELRQIDSFSFKSFARMDEETFNILLQKVSAFIKRQDTLKLIVIFSKILIPKKGSSFVQISQYKYLFYTPRKQSAMTTYAISHEIYKAILIG